MAQLRSVLNPSHTGRYSIYLPRGDGRLSWPIVDLIVPRRGVEPATFRQRVRRLTNAPTRQPYRLVESMILFMMSLLYGYLHSATVSRNWAYSHNVNDCTASIIVTIHGESKKLSHRFVKIFRPIVDRTDFRNSCIDHTREEICNKVTEYSISLEWSVLLCTVL